MVVKDIRLDFVTTLAPVAILGDFRTIVEFEGVRQFLVCLEFACGGAQVLAAVFAVKVERYLCSYRRT